MTAPLKLGLVGLGKIARDQHLPAIAATEAIELVAIASRNAAVEGLAHYDDIDALLAGEPGLDAVVMCQPPQPRFAAAQLALEAGKHVFLEKPPGATAAEVQLLADIAAARGVTLFASWHSRYAAGVGTAREWLSDRSLLRAGIVWKEDVRHWHPGQSWIWEPGGFGVFDPGINALSILTAVVAEPIRVVSAEFETPANCHAPIAARLELATRSGRAIAAEFDFRQTGPQTWDIILTTDRGELVLGEGGNCVAIDGVAQAVGPENEYPAMYRHFAGLVAAHRSDADFIPLQLVADAFLCARNLPTEEFHE